MWDITGSAALIASILLLILQEPDDDGLKASVAEEQFGKLINEALSVHSDSMSVTTD